MNKAILSYLPLCFICIIAIACISFSEVKQADMLCSDVRIAIAKNPYHSAFLNSDDVYADLNSNKSMFIGQNIQTININEMEATLKNDPSIIGCETFFKMSDTTMGKSILCIKIKQRTPIMRVHSSEGSFYIDENGIMLPLSERGSARVLVISGDFNNKYQAGANIFDLEDYDNLQNLFTLVKKIRDDEFLLPLIEQIDVTPQQEYILGTKIGPSTIEFGNKSNSDVKLSHLKAFYMSEKTKENWNKYKSISLKYKNQIVCTKF
ncbi:MAG: hypothetical protein MJ197_08290 [Bacteroidales bacterium]|nr:hypothetical protein [Bacteroidales bacterium]